MQNSNENNNADFLAKQHAYTRGKEKADKILARYDFIMKVAIGLVLGLFGFPTLLLFAFGALIQAIISLVIGGGILFFAYKNIKSRKEAHQAKLDSEIMQNL
ncbi:MAG: hypothetical protein FWC16_13200 [Defluviitaleaceae bacterium]|nr:hypothetical protein [Defluviitaleaceae bacterium]MCL2275877.1 hypothetical protein [Defluviitaleaceae bacterium]